MPISLTGLLPEEIQDLLEGEPSFRGKQIFTRIYKGTDNFADFSELPKNLRDTLQKRFSFFSSSIADILTGEDGTIKIKLSLKDDKAIEAVLLSDIRGRKTACLSTQAGCAMGCVFCKTGQLSLSRNLEPEEIAEQFLYLEKQKGTVSNIVFMGMGEPLQNLKNLRKAVNIFTHPLGKNLSHRRMTLSTCGLIQQIYAFTDEGPDIRLAVSLNSADQTIRSRIMPAAHSNPLDKLKEALIYYQEHRKRRITLEYVLLDSINDSPSDIIKLRDFMEGLNSSLNVIPYNPVPGVPLSPPAGKAIQIFLNRLDQAGIRYTRRMRRGRGIQGACGQLGSV